MSKNIYTLLKSSLIVHLEIFHPQLVSDTVFICMRSDKAAQYYEDELVDKGATTEDAYLKALHVLFYNLQFSRYEILKGIYIKKYGMEDEGQLSCLMEQCENIFQKYNLTDDFEEKPEYMELYSELEEEIYSV